MPLDDHRRSLSLAFAILAGLLGVLCLGACGEQQPQADTAPRDADRSSSPPPPQQPDPTPGAIASAKSLYERHCAACHGAQGRGDGPMARLLSPPPRGFVNEPWRYFTGDTPEQARAGIAKIIAEGIPSTGMPGFGEQLSDLEIQAIVDHVLKLRGDGAGG
ncbi:MAG: c-type cytochrome [Phycisphaerales bacterium JB039]